MKFQRTSTHNHDRRRFLRLAGTGLVGGLVTRLDREARGVETNEKRYILYNHCNALQSFHLAKSTVDSADKFTLKGFMEPFAPHQDKLTVVENMFCSPGKYLHGNGSSALSCTNRGMVTDGGSGISTLVVGGTTIDQVIAEKLQGDKRLRSLVLGHPLNLTNGNCVQGTLIGRASNEPVFPILDAGKAHELVFGVKGQTQVLLDLQKSYLDFVKDDISAFEKELPGQEKAKLQQYLQSVREVEKALVGLDGGQCPDLESKTFPRETRNDPPFWRYMCDLGVAALQCGATRQVTMLHTYGCVHFTYTFDGQSRNHHEDVSHKDEQGAFMEKILRFHAENVARMFTKLSEIPEGNGSMADNVLMSWMSDGGGQHHNGTRMHPMVYLGKAGGAVKGGQWLRYPKDTYALACAHVTSARAMGVNLKTFGDGQDKCEGPLPGVLA